MWFQYYKIPFKRINIDDTQDIIKEISKINVNDLSGYWYRRGDLTKPYLRNAINSEVQDYLNENDRKILEYFEYKMMSKKNLNSFFYSDLNKLIILEMAKECGLLVPDYQLLQSTLSLEKHKYIYKTVNKDGSIFDFKAKSIFNILTQEYTESVNYEFSPTLVQKKIEKKYELRIFYINEIFFTMAILSQKNQATIIDSRAIGEQNKSRMVPFSLPADIEENLKKLMIKTSINCGVIDLIVTPENDYVFLEINPIGQFGLISYNCNYYIEKTIAKYYGNK
jgi:ATP-GRASP peptide maturase of grasp-with-spasm system